MNMIRFFGKTDVGLVRQNNEDIFLFDQDRGFCLVADGMGGMAGGERASRFFAQAASENLSSGSHTSEADQIDAVQRTFWHANQSILNYVDENPHLQGMGCTAELLVFSKNRFVIGHMGDSRTYQFRNNRLKQLTKDHSLVQEQLDQGLISVPQAEVHSMRNIILRAVGVEADLQLDIIRGNIRQDDQYLICSDGLTDMVDSNAIADVLTTGAGLHQKVEDLIGKALSAGGNDNITVVLSMVCE